MDSGGLSIVTLFLNGISTLAILLGVYIINNLTNEIKELRKMMVRHLADYEIHRKGVA